tara:strand:- start:253 stop:831 length:579 start_codon:yes stop_codon:yes gene_type:complete
MSVKKYNEARTSALKILLFGLVFLLFLPVGVPVSLIIFPFLAGRIGAKELPKNWHTTYIITVGGGWSLGLVATIFVLLSLALGPALRINTVEPIIFGLLITLNWISFAIGVNSSKGSIQDVDIYQTEWEEEDSSNQETEMAVNQEKEVSASEKLKEFYKTSKKADAEKKEKQQNKKRTLSSRVGALASRRRK